MTYSVDEKLMNNVSVMKIILIHFFTLQVVSEAHAVLNGTGSVDSLEKSLRKYITHRKEESESDLNQVPEALSLIL